VVGESSPRSRGTRRLSTASSGSTPDLGGSRGHADVGREGWKAWPPHGACDHRRGTERFAPFAELHRQTAWEAGHKPPPALSINSHGYVAETSQQAADEFFPSYAAMMNAIGRERGWSPMTRQSFDALCSPRGALVVGSPQEVIEKILVQHEIFGHNRFLAQVSVGTLPHAKALRAIELLGAEVAPAVRTEIARRNATSKLARAGHR